MLKKKVLSLVLALSMLSGLGIVTAQAESTDAISNVVADTTDFNTWGNQYNRIVATAQNSNYAFAAAGIGGDTNGCVKATVGDKGIATESRWHQAFVTVDPSTGLTSTGNFGAYNIASATTPVYWSVDVYSNDITEIRMQVSSVMMHNSRISSSQLKANEWNTLAIAYYPNTTDTSKCGYADLYINGVYQDTKDLSSVNSTATQTRFYYNFASESAGANGVYFDNFKVYEMTSLTRGAVDTSDLTLTDDGKITNYTTTTYTDANYGTVADHALWTVAEVEEKTGATVYNANGTEATDSASIAEGMYVAASNTVDGIGTLKSASYEFDNVALTFIDSSLATKFANGWNRYMASKANLTGTGTTDSRGVTNGVDGDENNASASLLITDINEVGRFNFSNCYGIGTSSTKQTSTTCFAYFETPVVMSIDIWSNDSVTDVIMGANGDPFTSAMPASSLKANAWNTFTLVHYPNASDASMLGTADFYLNGKYIESADLTNKGVSNHQQPCILFTAQSAEKVIYIDNMKMISVMSFNAPEISGVTVEDGKIVDYAPQTVAEFEKATGLALKTSAGADAADAETVAAGMVAVATSAVEGVGTFTKSIELGEGKAYELGNWAVTVDGEAISGTTYGSGAALSATLPVTGTIPAMVTIIAEFNGDKFVQAITSNTTTVNCAITAGNTYKVLAWDSLTALNPLKDALVLTQQ